MYFYNSVSTKLLTIFVTCSVHRWLTTPLICPKPTCWYRYHRRADHVGKKLSVWVVFCVPRKVTFADGFSLLYFTTNMQFVPVLLFTAMEVMYFFSPTFYVSPVAKLMMVVPRGQGACNGCRNMPHIWILWPANFHWSAPDLQLMGNHLYG